MRVLFWSETFWPRLGGVERLAAGLLPALRGRGHEFAVVTWVDEAAADEAAAAARHHDAAFAQSRFDGIEIHRFPFFAGSGRSGAQRTIEHLAEIRLLKRRFVPDLVHVNSCGRSAWFHLATDRAAAPTLVTLHQPLPAAPGDDESIPGRLLATASWIACCSHGVLRTVRTARPALAGRTSVIGNALPDAGPCPPAASFAPPQLLFIGRLVHEKGLDAVLGALQPLFARRPDLHLVVAGDGPLRPQLEAQAQAPGLAGRVRFIGAVAPDVVQDLLTAASLVIVPSRVEGFGLVALEAAAMGRPVIASDAGGLPEVVEHERTGLVVPGGDASAFVRAIGRLIDDPDDARRMGAQARMRALTSFDWQRHVRAYDDLYRRLAA